MGFAAKPRTRSVIRPSPSFARRRLLVAGGAGFAAAIAHALTSQSATNTAFGSDQSEPQRFGDDFCVPRLFCTAYVTPGVADQSGQEAVVARYPLALVPQDDRAQFVGWRDRIRHLNPSIVMLGYQQVIEETTVPGPGHDELRKADDAWVQYPGGVTARVPSNAGRALRIYDPRSRQWQSRFLAACRATLESYSFDGLFLDQCTVFRRAYLSEESGAEMREALQETLLRLRAEHPHAVLVGNSSHHWAGLNGELNEGRPNDLQSACAPYPGHARPELTLYQSLVPDPGAVALVEREMAAAHRCGAFYGVARDYQHVLWYDMFDHVSRSCTR
ncbi:MAG TPA: hypothetical protein VMB76_14790 [Casimicrobiaceae bacterium]|jgi:hypothetical protein|nr:hypothetical protein [Casimicrobiaceae bacterium]